MLKEAEEQHCVNDLYDLPTPNLKLKIPLKDLADFITIEIRGGTMLSFHVDREKINAAISFPICVSPNLSPF